MKWKISLVLVAQLSLLLGCGGGHGGAGGAVAPAITAQPTNQRVVVGSPATFTVTATGSAPLSYQWQKGGTPISGATAPSYTTPATTLVDDGSSFQVVVSNSAGSVTSNSVMLTVAAGTAVTRGVDVTTFKNDLNRSGQNLAESALTLTNVASSTFGLLRLLPVDGLVDAQPLYLSALSASGGTFNTVFVATEHDSVYAFDSDSGAILWHVSLLGTGETTSDTRGCGQVSPEIGVTSTPVIDRTAGPHGTIYVVAMTKDSSSNYHHRLHALDVATGAELLNGPVEISASFPATGTATSSFDPKSYEERAALLLSNGTIYTAGRRTATTRRMAAGSSALRKARWRATGLSTLRPTAPRDPRSGWPATVRRWTRRAIFIFSRRMAHSRRHWTRKVFPAVRISAIHSSRSRAPPRA